MRILVAWVSVFICAVSLNAASLRDYVPKDVLAYVEWRNGTSLGKTYSRSTTSKLVQRIEFEQMLGQMIQQASGMAMMMGGGLSDDMGGDMGGMNQMMGMTQMITPMIGALSDAEVSVYVVKSDRKDIPVKVGVICRGGEGAMMLRQQMQMMVQMGQGMAAQKGTESLIEMIEGEEIFGVILGGSRYESFSWVGETGVVSNPKFKKMLEQSGGESVMAAFVDVKAGLDFALEQRWIDQIHLEQMAEYGFGNVTAAGYIGGIHGKDWVTLTALFTEGKHEGILSLFDQPMIESQDLAVVPIDSPYMSVVKIDGDNTFNKMLELASRFDPTGQNSIEANLESMKDQMGIDLKNDILKQLKNGGVVYFDPALGDKAETVMDSVCLAVRVTDESAFMNTLEKAFAMVGQMFEIKKTITDDGVIIELANPMSSQFVGMSKKWVVVTSKRKLVEGALDRIANNGESILANEIFLRTRDDFVSVPMWQFTYADLIQTAPAMYSANEGMMNPMFPTLGTLARYLDPMGSVVWSDREGVYAKSISPFPFSFVLTPQSEISSNLFGMFSKFGMSQSMPGMPMQQSQPQEFDNIWQQ
ncbi:hypothetical protein JD969_06300 [Planctomycetota bacterium]|nr:hypothetical protein JD969_06300 [Planctomycetota bacterium]